MVKKPTYEELEHRVMVLEKSALRHERFDEEFERISDLSPDLIGSGNLEGYFTKINSALGKILGYSEKEFYTEPFLAFIHDDDVEKTKTALDAAITGKQNIYVENRYKCKDGSYKWIDWHVLSLVSENKFYAVGRDITERKRLEEALIDKAQRLETLNTALNVLLKRRTDDKADLEERFFENIKLLVLPFLDKIRSGKRDTDRKILIDIIQENLMEVTSPFTRNLSTQYLNLSPSEIQVVDLIKHGKSTKEIASLLNLSPKTVKNHRQAIRKKLGLLNRKTKLQSYLLSIH